MTIVVYHPVLAEQYVSMLHARFPALEFVPVADVSELEQVIVRAEILLAHISLPCSSVSRAPNLGWIQVLGAGADRMIPCVPPNVRLSRLTGSFGTRMAEYAIGYVLALTQRIPEVVRNQLAHDWSPLELGVASEQTLGVAGLGSIGSAVARLGSGIGMKVTATSTRPTELEFVDEWFDASRFDSFLGSADFVVLTLPATPLTHHIVNREVLPSMRPGSWLINMSRGSLVDEDALIEGLEKGRPAGAVLDVFELEPLPVDHPFWDIPNVIVTPHHSGAAIPEEGVEIFVANLDRYQSGEPLINEVDMARGY